MGIFSSIFGQTNNEQLKEAIQNKAFLVDVRTPAEFSAGSVSGAVNIPLDSLEYQLAQFKNKGSIIVFCRSGSRSAQAKSILEQNGIKNVINGGAIQDVYQAVNQ